MVGGVRPGVPQISTLNVRSMVLFSNGDPLWSFGDSGVKGSGKMVGLAAEHKGAWVINLLVHTVPTIFQVHIYN